MAINVKYYYLGQTPTKVTKNLDAELTPDVTKKNTKYFNSIFNFDQSFVDELQNINQLDIAQSIPYISLRTKNEVGDILQDLNLSFFHKQADFDNISNSPLRYPERPTMSLQNLEIKTTQASGYLYYTNVTIKLKIHSPDALKNTTLFALLVPEIPLELEYGWNSPNSFLGEENREILLFQVKNYNLNLDATGQINLVVEGMAFNEKFNTYLGDTGQNLTNEILTDGKQFNGLSRSLDLLKKRLEHLKTLQQTPDFGPNDYEQVKIMAETYQSNEKSVRGAIAAEFDRLLNQLSAVEQEEKISKTKTLKLYRFHDIIKILCNDTFKAMGTLFLGTKEFRIIYGRFNSFAGSLANTSIADFPIIKNKFKEILKRKRTSGQFVPTVEDLLNILIDNFVENGEYTKSLINEKQAEAYVSPQISFNFTNKNGIVELQIIDIKANLPVTTKDLMPSKKGPAADVEKNALDSGLAVIRLGHANSFIQNVSLSQMTDQYMKAALIERMYRNRLESPRSTIPPSISQESKPVNPLHLPLKGTAEVLGHTQWKPFRAFFLSTGIFLVDAVYQITSVTHILDSSGYKTKIEFIYH